MSNHLAPDTAELAFVEVFGRETAGGMDLVYDVTHNIAKLEEHVVDGSRRVVCVHRKGATRACGAGHGELHRRVRDLGQPVLIPGDMRRYSYLLVGTEGVARGDIWLDVPMVVAETSHATVRSGWRGPVTCRASSSRGES